MVLDLWLGNRHPGSLRVNIRYLPGLSRSTDKAALGGRSYEYADLDTTDDDEREDDDTDDESDHAGSDED